MGNDGRCQSRRLRSFHLSTATTKQNKLTLRTITLGGKSIAGAILSEENRKYFQNIAKNLNSYLVEKLHQNIPFASKLDNINSPTQPAEDPTKNIMEHGFEIPEELQSSESTVLAQKTLQPIVSSPATNHQLDNTIRMLELNRTQYKQLSDNNYRITQNHTAFLQARKDFSKQMSEIIQLQLVCAENLLNEQT